jgi:hypothetical protein
MFRSKRRTRTTSRWTRRNLSVMLAVGDPIPDVRVWVAPRERMPLRNLTAGRTLMLLTFLFAWTST